MITKKFILLCITLVSITLFLFLYKVPDCYAVTATQFPETKEPEKTDIVKTKEGIKEFTYIAIPVLGKSMQPTITNGSFCICEEAMEYEEGDIVTFYVYNGNLSFISHRIIEKKVADGENYYWTKGDANVCVDRFVLKDENIFCKIKHTIPIEKLYNIITTKFFRG